MMSSASSVGTNKGLRGSSSNSSSGNSSDGTSKEKRGSNVGSSTAAAASTPRSTSTPKSQNVNSSSDDEELSEAMDVSTKRHWSSSSDEAITPSKGGNNNQNGSRSTSPKDEEGSPPPNQDVYRSESSGSDDSDGDPQKEDDDSSDTKKRKSSHTRPQRKLRKGDDGISLRSSTRELRRSSTDSSLQNSPALTPIVPGSNPYNIVLTPESMLSKDVSDLPSGWSTMVKPRKKTGGRKDLYFVSPDGRCYRSKKQVYQLLGVPLEMIQNAAKVLSEAKGKTNIPKSLQNTLNQPKTIEKPPLSAYESRRMLRSMKTDETEFAELHMFKTDSSRYSIQIGDEFQAKLPEYAPSVNTQAKPGDLNWDPSRVAPEELEKYLETIRVWNYEDLSRRPSAFPKGRLFEGKTRKYSRWSYSEERALSCLHSNNYDVKAALSTIQQHIAIFKDENRRRTYGEPRIGIADEFMYLVEIDPDRRYSTESIEDESCFYCEKEGTVVICDNPSCKRVFHPSCAGVKQVPEGEWKCPVCITDQVLSQYWPNVKYNKDLPELLKKKQNEFIETYNLRVSTGTQSPKRSEISRPRRGQQFLTKGTSEDKPKQKPNAATGSSSSSKSKKLSPASRSEATTTTTSSLPPPPTNTLPPLLPDSKATMVSLDALDSYVSLIDSNMNALRQLRESLTFRKQQNHPFIYENEMHLLQNLTSASRQAPASNASVSTPVAPPTHNPLTALPSAPMFPYLAQQQLQQSAFPYLNTVDITVLAQVPYDVITQGYLAQVRAMNHISQLQNSFLSTFEEFARNGSVNIAPKPPFPVQK